jgi:hypothetical protein
MSWRLIIFKQFKEALNICKPLDTWLGNSPKERIRGSGLWVMPLSNEYIKYLESKIG